MTDEPVLDAGDFSTWLREVRAAIRGQGGTDVPCGTCTACCTSSQFVHIAPDETDTLARIPKALLFPAPRAPRGHVLMGFDERGHCPMLVGGACSIYADRPRTCRTYDCRVFAAAGVERDDPEVDLIARRARQWRFRHDAAGEVEHAAVRAAAAYVRARARDLPVGAAPANATQLAVLAVEVADAFVVRDAAGEATTVTEPTTEVFAAALARRP